MDAADGDFIPLAEEDEEPLSQMSFDDDALDEGAPLVMREKRDQHLDDGRAFSKSLHLEVTDERRQVNRAFDFPMGHFDELLRS